MACVVYKSNRPISRKTLCSVNFAIEVDGEKATVVKNRLNGRKNVMLTSYIPTFIKVATEQWNNLAERNENFAPRYLLHGDDGDDFCEDVHGDDA